MSWRRVLIGSIVASTLVLAGCSSPDPTDPPAVAVSTPEASPVVATATSAAPAPAPAARLSGTLFYLGAGNANGGLYTLRSGVVTKVVNDTSFMFFQSAVVSPDGTKVAFVVADGAGATGQLRVQTIGGGSTTIGPTTIGNLIPPQWTPDGSGVLVGYGTGGQYGLVTIATGAVTPVTSASGCCFSLRSPDGNYAIVRGSAISITRADGTSPVPGVVPAGKTFHRLQSLSPDGRHVTALVRDAGTPGGDAGRAIGSNAIVDLPAGTIGAVPGGGTLREGWYQANGNLLLRVNTGSSLVVRLVSPAGTVLDELTEPAGASGLELLGYAA
jgi:TolB protein